ncbi:hypothetical protein [Gynuella sunshinyii]|uniref:hypothetical protein n=1 Tax=Gynuella sunshinyii TaxID=1445505 RepID=UPI001186AC81|nr:hypothetical protein [Gynuella sunshinyii]
MAIDASYTAIFAESTHLAPVTETFKIKSRIIGPSNDPANPTQGSDVELLEMALWQLGISPQKSGTVPSEWKAGAYGAEINSLRFTRANGTEVWTTNCTGELANDRSIFYPGNVNDCAVGRVSLELMLAQFQARNNNNNYYVSTDEIDAQTGRLDDVTLVLLKRDYMQYMSSRHSNPRPVIRSSDTQFATWLDNAVAIWSDGITLPDGESHVPASYTEAIHNQVIAEAGIDRHAEAEDDPYTRARLLQAWIGGESPHHWGTNAAATEGQPYQPTPYRITEGADEHGSLSFSQLVYPLRYGTRSACAALTATDLNLYDPADQVKLFTVYLSSESTDDHNCPGGMNQAFAHNNLGTNYELADTAGENIHDLVRIVGKDTLGTAEDHYEKLAKAVFYYNSAHRWIQGPTRKSWPFILKYKQYRADSTGNSTRTNVCHSCKYSIQIRREFLGRDHLRTYIWAGGRYPLVLPDGTAHPNGGQAWCLAYGEHEWISGVTFDSAMSQTRRIVNGNPNAGDHNYATTCN